MEKVNGEDNRRLQVTLSGCNVVQFETRKPVGQLEYSGSGRWVLASLAKPYHGICYDINE